MRKKGIFDIKADTITIKELICNYLCEDQSLDRCDLTHKDLKQFRSPYLICVPFDFVYKNIELVKRQSILLVRDKRNNVAPYVNPADVKLLDSTLKVDELLKDIKKKSLKPNELLIAWYELKKILITKEKIDQTFELLEEIRRDDVIDKIFEDFEEGEYDDKRK